MSLIDKARVKSPWVLHFDCGGCNGCDIEVLACLTPVYDVERFGIVNVGNPKHADVLVVTGPVNHRNARVLRQLYDQMPEPKAVVAVGACAATGGVFHNCYNILGGIDRVIPVDVYVPGCCVRPEQVIDGIVLAMQKKLAKAEAVKNGKAAEALPEHRPLPQLSETAPADRVPVKEAR
jgi:ech hydrogenase subunit C